MSEPRVTIALDNNYQIETRDVFQAKLNSLLSENYAPLLIAVLGEIGNNSFDHNLGSWRDLVGIYFRTIKQRNDTLILIADRGQGLKATLGRILPEISSDLEAIKIAFTKVISGRSPEQRGNGLKFVTKIIQKNHWELFFQSGHASAVIQDTVLSFENSANCIFGCLAIIKVSKIGGN